MTAHPYGSLPGRNYWRRAVSDAFRVEDVPTVPTPLIRRADRIVSAGSCFAANIVPYLEGAGFSYFRTEFLEPIWNTIPAENFSYAKFSAGYGNIYTARQLNQLLKRCIGTFRPAEDRWTTPEGIVDPFRPGLRYLASSEPEFDRLTQQHLDLTLKAFRECDVFIFTLGLTETWESTLDGAVFPACPGTIMGRGVFDPDRHVFRNLNINEVQADLVEFLETFRTLNPNARVILTVSPVPLVATATDRHVLQATIYSKSVLRVAAEMACQAVPNVHYFPAYEIVTGPQAPETLYEADRRNVSQEAVQTVMRSFLSVCEGGSDDALPPAAPPARSTAEDLSAAIVAFECEEAGQDQPG